MLTCISVSMFVCRNVSICAYMHISQYVCISEVCLWSVFGVMSVFVLVCFGYCHDLLPCVCPKIFRCVCVSVSSSLLMSLNGWVSLYVCVSVCLICSRQQSKQLSGSLFWCRCYTQRNLCVNL